MTAEPEPISDLFAEVVDLADQVAAQITDAEIEERLADVIARADDGLSPRAAAAVAAGVPDSTRRAAASNVAQFEAWCRETGHQPVPCSPDTLTEYGTFLAYALGMKPGSIERARWAILRAHRLAGVTPPPTEGLTAVLRGYRARLAASHDPRSLPRQATPLTRSAMAAIFTAMDMTKNAGIRDKAMILTGFAVGARRSELAGLDIGSVEFRPEGMQVRVYRAKTRTMTTPVVKYRENPGLCPVRALQAWLAVLAAHGRTSGPLFLRIDRHDNLAPVIIRAGKPIGDQGGRMNGQSISNRLRLRATAAGLPGNWSGHSGRRGVATEMHRAGKKREDIESRGGWAPGSTAVAGYIEEVEQWMGDALAGVL